MASLLHTLLHGRANVSAANEHEQAGFRGQVADASRNARFGERQTIASLPIVTALRSRHAISALPASVGDRKGLVRSWFRCPGGVLSLLPVPDSCRILRAGGRVQ